MEDQELFEKVALYFYEEGLIHGFTLGKAKPPRPEDKARLDQMRELTINKLRERFKEQKGLEDGNLPDVTTSVQEE